LARSRKNALSVRGHHDAFLVIDLSAGIIQFVWSLAVIKLPVARPLCSRRLWVGCVRTSQGHTILLNMNSKGLPIITELLNAKESEGGGTIVVMCDIPKAELEASIRDELEDGTKGSRVICRCGSTRSPHNLRRLSLQTAKSVIILSVEEPGVSRKEMDGTALHTLLQVSSSSHAPEVLDGPRAPLGGGTWCCVCRAMAVSLTRARTAHRRSCRWCRHR
jgi:hypothetical protein